MKELMKEIRKFNEERDWDKFHSPENLAKSISIEAGELLECFQWDSENYNKEEVCEELADVFTYCVQMAIKLNVDPEDIILKKLEKTKKKYPVEKLRKESKMRIKTRKTLKKVKKTLDWSSFFRLRKGKRIQQIAQKRFVHSSLSNQEVL